MIKNKKTLLFVVVIIAVLVVSYFWGDNVPSPSTATTTEKTSNLTAEEKIQLAQEIIENTDTDVETLQPPENVDITEQTIQHEDISQGNPIDDTCYISVRCDSVLNNLQYLDESKKRIIPQDGIIYENPTAVIYEGESVFNLLTRELKKNNIHYEYVKTPAYNSVYIEGIGNLYEFDCGELSGWLYKVNGKSPSCGCSQYTLSPGDKVEFVYSCNLGIDVDSYKGITN